MAKDKLVKSITGRDEDFAQWYTDVCKKAELMDYTDAKGFIIYRPYGYALWERMQAFMDRRFKETGHENVYMPMMIPESLFLKEAEHVEGFAPETAIVTIGGKETLQERLIIRPTSEVLFCDHYAKIVSSYRDLPKLYNQWCSVVRWEKTTRPFLRGSEFLWQEGHTIHATEQEARHEVRQMLDIYDELGRDVLAIPFVKGRKTDKEKFAGAEETYSIEALMHDGKALQSGTSHYFGTGFANAFNIRFQDKDSLLKTVYQTSWGASTRLIGAVIMVHGDDSGLVLPPRLAPTQVVIVLIQSSNEDVQKAASLLKDQLTMLGVRVKVDDSDKSPGWKFAEHEMKGIPVRIEVGPRDLAGGEVVVVKRVDGEKIRLKIDEAAAHLPALLERIHHQMYQNALANLEANTFRAATYDQFKETISTKGGYVKMMLCDDRACEDKIKEDTAATARCIPFEQELLGETCPVCGKPATKMVYFAKAY